MKLQNILSPGDLLLYPPKSICGWIISIKTWELVSHIECYVGSNLIVASRDGIGVGMFELRHDMPAVILRPKGKFKLDKAMKYFKTVAGQKYDWLGLLVFTLATRKGSTDRQFCSEFARNFMAAGGIESFNPDFVSDQVAPATFMTSLAYSTIACPGRPSNCKLPPLKGGLSHASP